MKRILYIAILSIAVINLSSCEKDNGPAVVYPSLETFLTGNGKLTFFNALIDKAQLQSFKSGPGPFTWIAPTDQAFQAAGVTMDSINRMTVGQANYLAQYHLSNGSLKTIDMVGQNSFARATQLGSASSVYIGQYNDSFYVNGAAIISTDNMVANGVVHILDRLMVPPNLKGNIQAVLNSTGQHSLFIAALTRGGRWTTLGTTSVFTVFAPTNTAMTAAGYTTASINASSVGLMDSLVRYHMFSGTRLFTNDIGEKTTPGTFLGVTKTLKGDSKGRRIKGISNPAAIDISKSDIVATNGVVHVIEGILRY